MVGRARELTSRTGPVSAHRRSSKNVEVVSRFLNRAVIGNDGQTLSSLHDVGLRSWFPVFEFIDLF
jgi:hypothetical protein